MSEKKKRKPYKTRFGHRLRRVFASLDDGSIAKAKELGNGNLSAGVRTALSLAQVAALVPGSSPGASSAEAVSVRSAQASLMEKKLTLEDKLIALKNLAEAGLISNEIYLERQRLILDGEG